jgi:hypothetical protein
VDGDLHNVRVEVRALVEGTCCNYCYTHDVIALWDSGNVSTVRSGFQPLL